MGRLHNWLIAAALLISISSMIQADNGNSASGDSARGERQATMTAFRLQGYVNPASVR